MCMRGNWGKEESDEYSDTYLPGVRTTVHSCTVRL